jgi:hypothetical protein
MKKLITAVLIVLLTASFASGTNVRVLTLGDNNMILQDEANIFLFPSTIMNYQKLVQGEFGRVSDDFFEYGDFTDFGVHWKIGEENPFVLGTYLHNSAFVAPYPFSTIQFNWKAYNPFDGDPLPNRRINLFGGKMLGTTPFGANLQILHSSESHDDDNLFTKDEAKLAVYSLTAGITLVPDIDLAAGIQVASFTDVGTYDASGTPTAYDQTTSEGNMVLHGLIRKTIVMNPNYRLIPHLGAMMETYKFHYFDPPATKTLERKWTAAQVDGGVGLNWEPVPEALCIFDMGLAVQSGKVESTPTGSSTTENKTTNLVLPYFKMGCEGNVFSWMDVRFGATSYWLNVKDEDKFTGGSDEHKYNFPANDTYLGFGFHWNRLHVDTYADPSLFLDGFNFISGQSNIMNFSISAKYDIN